MNIGIGCNSIFDKYGHYKKYDGIGNYTFNLLKELKKTDKLNITTCYFNMSGFFNHQHNDLFIERNPFLADLLPFNLHNNLAKKIQLFHSTDHLIPKLKKTPIIATIHDATLFKGVSYKDSWSRHLKNALLKKHAAYADHVVTVSHATVPDLVNYWGIHPDKISVVYNGIDENWFEALSALEKEKTLKKYGLNKKFILSVGTLYPKKNIDRVLSAYLALPEVLQQEYDLVLVGKEGWDCDELVQRIKTLQLKGHIKWLDYVAYTELRALYQSTSLLVFVSLDEGFGFPIIEGFASRVPVITSNVSSMPEIAGDAATLVDPTSVDAISSAMQERLLRSDRELIDKGFARAKQFSWEKNARDIVGIYQRYL